MKTPSPLQPQQAGGGLSIPASFHSLPWAWQDHTTPPPPAQVDCGSQSLPRLPLGIPALTHPPCEVAALAGVPDKGGAGSSFSLVSSCSPAFIHPFLFSSTAPPLPSPGHPVAPGQGPLEVATDTRGLGLPCSALGVANLGKEGRTRFPGRRARGLLPTLCQGLLGVPWVLLGQPGAGRTWGVTEGAREAGCFSSLCCVT